MIAAVIIITVLAAIAAGLWLVDRGTYDGNHPWMAAAANGGATARGRRPPACAA